MEDEAINSQASPRVQHDSILYSARSTLMYDVRVLLPMTARVQHDPILCSARSLILLPWGWVPTAICGAWSASMCWLYMCCGVLGTHLVQEGSGPCKIPNFPHLLWSYGTYMYFVRHVRIDPRQS